MNAQRFVRQLQREVKTHPKRAALLAGLIAVGIYFWVPLVAGWMTPDATAVSSPPAQSAAVPIGGVSSSDPKTADARETPDLVPWTQLWEAIREDQRTKPATSLAATVDPFRPFPAPEEPADDGASTAVAQGAPASPANATAGRTVAPTDPTPRSLGMKLTGTIIGTQRRAAVIDGKVVVEGGMVTSGAASQTGAADETSGSKPAGDVGASSTARFAFRVASVEPQSAVLERDGKSYKLAIESPKVAGTDFAVRASQSSN